MDRRSLPLIKRDPHIWMFCSIFDSNLFLLFPLEFQVFIAMMRVPSHRKSKTSDLVKNSGLVLIQRSYLDQCPRGWTRAVLLIADCFVFMHYG